MNSNRTNFVLWRLTLLLSDVHNAIQRTQFLYNLHEFQFIDVQRMRDENEMYNLSSLVWRNVKDAQNNMDL